MDRDNDRALEHLPLEEVKLSDILVTPAPASWVFSHENEGPKPPPVLVEQDRGLVLVGNHRTFWRAAAMNRSTIRCLVVRSAVQVGPAHESISNAAEEPLLFQGLLRAGIIENRSRLADMLGFSRARVTQVLNLLKLPDELRQEVLADDSITEYQLRPLIRLEGADRQISMFRELMSRKLTGRQMALFAETSTASEAVTPTDAPVHAAASTREELEAVFSDLPQPPKKEEKAPVKIPKETTAPRFTAVDDTPAGNILHLLSGLGTLREPGWKAAAAEAGADQLDMRFLEGVSQLRRGLFTAAMDTLSEVIRRSPDYSAAWFFMGKCANLMGALNDAEDYLRNAVERDPNQPDFHMELAVVLEKQKRDTEALTLFRKANALRKALRRNEKT
ncbi:MAG: tetratricopeptide repeat protein [Candidatus Fermentibacteraceae bacterium]